MRKSTEFPVWLDRPETRARLKGKQVLMYCTGGIRCERASALLRYKMETDESVQELGIQNVYQLQGGIDKYFKQFPDGGYWQGKNYTFDKRFAHAPVEKEAAGQQQQQAVDDDDDKDVKPAATTVAASAVPPVPLPPMGQCEACGKPWDRYRGKRRCPTCGVPSLICRDCFQADQKGTRRLDRSVRCDLCVEQDVSSKKALRAREQRELEEYERRQQAALLLQPTTATTQRRSCCCTPYQQHQQQQQPRRRHALGVEQHVPQAHDDGGAAGRTCRESRTWCGGTTATRASSRDRGGWKWSRRRRRRRPWRGRGRWSCWEGRSTVISSRPGARICGRPRIVR